MDAQDVADGSRIAVLGAGAMGTALAVHTARNGADSVLLATEHDDAVVDSWRRGLPHPALRMPFHHYVSCRPASEWAAALSDLFLTVVSGARPFRDTATG